MSDLSREEAIKYLELDIKNFVCGDCYPEKETDCAECEYKIALDMAIEALKREKRALQLKSKVRNIDGWQNIVNEVARLEAEERGESNEDTN